MKLKVLALVGSAALLAAGLLAQQHQHGSHQSAKMTSDKGMSEECQRMMAERDGFMSGMHAMDARLNELLAQMEAAQGQDKLHALEELVKEIVAQRAEMREKMMGYHSQMMQHMGSHMKATMMQGETPGAKACPMMGGSQSKATH